MAPAESKFLFLLMSVRINRSKLLGHAMAGVCHSSHEAIMYVNSAKDVAKPVWAKTIFEDKQFTTH